MITLDEIKDQYAYSLSVDVAFIISGCMEEKRIESKGTMQP